VGSRAAVGAALTAACANIAAVEGATDAPAPADTDAALVRRIAAGEHDALRELYARYGALAHSLARRLLGDRQLAEEVVQDVFFTFWRQARRYDPDRGRVVTWLIRLTRNRAVEQLRGDPPAVAAAAAEAEGVARAVADLPVPQFEVLRLAYFDGLPPAEVAERVGVPPGAVQARLRLALNGMRSLAEPRERVEG
jgi:RNA polymerase sigma factor (sigma-70 family)